MALKADLYLDRIDIEKYFSQEKCNKSCGFLSCSAWIRAVKDGTANLNQCLEASPTLTYSLEVVLSVGSIIPEVEIYQHPVQGILGHHEINRVDQKSPVLVTGNAAITQEVLMAILSTTTAPFHLLFIDCLGHTVDMAMVYETFTAERLLDALGKADLASHVIHRELILPGVTAPIADEMKVKSGWNITIGPYCAGELPLFMGERWSRPPNLS